MSKGSRVACTWHDPTGGHLYPCIGDMDVCVCMHVYLCVHYIYLQAAWCFLPCNAVLRGDWCRSWQGVENRKEGEEGLTREGLREEE